MTIGRKKNVEVPLDTMLEWFHANYEDAIHGVFYSGRDEGYQYAPGAGPHDPLDELQGEFPNADLDVLQGAADILGFRGGAWIKKGRY